MIRLLLPFSLLLTTITAAAGEWQAGAEARLDFQGRYQGEAFDGRFTRFTAKIVFDTEALDAASFEVEIDVTSAATGIEEYDGGMQEPEFFHGSKFPTARFVTRAFRALGENRYEADADLTIRDKTVPLTFPFRFEIDGEQAQLTAAVTIRRLDFDIGTGDWTDTSLISNDVEVRVDLPLLRSD